MTGATASINFITTNAPKTLPNNRIHNDNGFITSSITFIGATIATGSAKLLSQPFGPLLLIQTT